MRPAGQKKLGFFPCPPRIVDMVLSHIKPTTNSAWLDPCAGKGEAITQIGRATHALIYGVEFDENNAPVCRELPFTQFLEGNSLTGIRFPYRGYDGLWFNPPYDRSKEFGRLETEFMAKIVKERRVLRDGGLFVGILPVRALRSMAGLLMNCLNGNGQEYPHVYLFPDPEYDDFGQAVVLGTMRPRLRYVVSEKAKEEWIALAESDDLPALDFATEPTWRIPFHEGKAKPADMVSLIFQPREAFRQANKVGWFTRPAATDALWAKQITDLSTLRTLRAQHLATAVAAGFLNNQVVDSRPEGGEAQMVKGRTQKYLTTVADREKNASGATVTTKIEMFVSEIVAIRTDGTITVYRLRKGEAND
jgi:hypothetical protein